MNESDAVVRTNAACIRGDSVNSRFCRKLVISYCIPIPGDLILHYHSVVNGILCISIVLTILAIFYIILSQTVLLHEVNCIIGTTTTTLCPVLFQMDLQSTVRRCRTFSNHAQ